MESNEVNYIRLSFFSKDFLGHLLSCSLRAIQFSLQMTFYNSNPTKCYYTVSYIFSASAYIFMSIF